LSRFTDADLTRQVLIYGKGVTVHEALARALAHIGYHIGQIALLARILSDSKWQWISIPPGKSREYRPPPR
jgi:hypothetical protein